MVEKEISVRQSSLFRQLISSSDESVFLHKDYPSSLEKENSEKDFDFVDVDTKRNHDT